METIITCVYDPSQSENNMIVVFNKIPDSNQISILQWKKGSSKRIEFFLQNFISVYKPSKVYGASAEMLRQATFAEFEHLEERHVEQYTAIIIADESWNKRAGNYEIQK